MAHTNTRMFIYWYMDKQTTWSIFGSTSSSFGIVIVNGFNQYLHTLVGLTISDAIAIGSLEAMDTDAGSMAAGF